MTNKAVFETNGQYVARYLESNRITGISGFVRKEHTVCFTFSSTPNARSFELSLRIETHVTVEDGCERLTFASPTGKPVVCYSDNRLYDDKYLKTHEVAVE